MVISMVQIPAYATAGEETTRSAPVLSDMPHDWSTAAIKNAVVNGLFAGSNGKIQQNDPLTRAQVAAVIVRAFGATVKGDLKEFSDINSSDWYADDMAKAYQMGVIKGSNGKLSPKDSITRQEVFAILARAFIFQPADTISQTFTDVNEIFDWAKGEVYAVVNGGYVQGNNGILNPKGFITRAEFAQVFDNILKQYIRTAGEYTMVANGNIMINTSNVTLKDLKVNGDLIIGDGVRDGEVILDHVEVTGRMVIRGGGVNYIKITGNSNIQNMIIARVDGQIIVGANSTIETVAVDGENVTITVSEGSKIENIVVNSAGANISGNGDVGTVAANANNVTVTTPNTSVSAEEGTTGVIAGTKPVLPGETIITPENTPPASSGGTGGGSGGSSTDKVSAPAAVVPETIATGLIPGVTSPVYGAIPVSTIADTIEYTAMIAWSPADVTFSGSTAYTATITITPKTGYTLTGVPANFFHVAGTPPLLPVVSNPANSGVVTAIFPTTAHAPLPGQSGAPAYAAGTPATFGSQLTVGAGTLGITTSLTYTWYRSTDATYGSGTDTSLETGTSYTPIEADIANYLIVVATSTDAAGNGTIATASVVAKAAGPVVPSEAITATFPVAATSLKLAGLAASATGLQATVAIDGSTYGVYADLAVNAIGNATISGLTGVTASTKVKIREKETAATLAGADREITVTALLAMTGTVAIAGTEKFGSELIATPSLTGAGTPTYQWNRDGVAIDGTTGTTYTLVEADITKIITVTAIADGFAGTGSITSAATGAIAKANGPAAPEAPTLQNRTDKELTLTPDALQQFSKDNGVTWQDNDFGVLTATTTYTFVARMKETSTTNASTASAGTFITTKTRLDRVAKPTWSGNVINWVGVANTEYYGVYLCKDGNLNDGEWSFVETYDFGPKITSEGAGSYTVYIVAKGDGEGDYVSGPDSELSDINEIP